MRKITFTIALALVGVIAYSQNVIVDRPNDNNTGLISTEGNDGTGVYCADWFEITEEIAVGEITVIGFSSSGGDITSLVTAWNLYIFEDFGVPSGNPEAGGALYELNIPVGGFTLTNDGGNQAVFTVDNITAANGGEQVILTPGEYWISAFPSVNSTPGGAGRWNWTGSLDTPGAEPVLIDPADLFGLGVTSWANISGLIGENFPSFAWSLIDEPINLSVGDNLAEAVSIFPTLATDVINVRVPSSIEIIEVSLHDVLGRNTGAQFSNGTVNVEGLSRGVYMLTVNTTEGTLTQKVVKK